MLKRTYLHLHIAASHFSSTKYHAMLISNQSNKNSTNKSTTLEDNYRKQITAVMVTCYLGGSARITELEYLFRGNLYNSLVDEDGGVRVQLGVLAEHARPRAQPHDLLQQRTLLQREMATLYTGQPCHRLWCAYLQVVEKKKYQYLQRVLCKLCKFWGYV